MEYHKPVLLNEIIWFFEPEPGKKYIDCTLGDAGHTIEILKRGGTVLGIDYNQTALDRAQKRIKSEGLNENFAYILANFKDVEKIARQHNFTNVDGIIYDLGYSSFQLDCLPSGLSFQKEEKLDMRIDKSLGVTAEDLVNSLPENQLAKLIYEYSDEKLAKKFAKAIVNHRGLKKIQTTRELAKILVDETPSGYEHGRIHPATRTFQALRIAVNDELTNLELSLPRAARMLRGPKPQDSLPGGRMAIVSFHSLEDKIVKDFGRSARLQLEELTKKPIKPSETEMARNIRSRSAKLRIYQKRI